MKDILKLQESYGEVVELITPSNNRVVIRKQNGADDDILTNSVYASKGTGIARFIAGIIVDSSYTATGLVTYEEVAKLRVADIYFLAIASRIFSLGNLLQFTYQWEDIPEKSYYEEDLNDFIWDYSLPFPEEGDGHYSRNRIRPVSKETSRELVLGSGKILKYDFMSSNGEAYLMTLSNERQSINQELFARNLMIFENEKWVKVEHFKFFSPLDMAAIRRDIKEFDPPLSVFSEIENPETKAIVKFPIVGTIDFFFPHGI